MGMGEPLANRENVMAAWRILTDSDGFAMSRRKVTISTVGLPNQIRKLAEEPYPPKLVFSICSPDDKIRRKVLPVAGKFSLAENHQALKVFAENTRNRITLALLVADGFNDTKEDARKLHRWIGQLPVKINLLRYNETDSDMKRAEESKVEAVASELIRLGHTVILRSSRGRDVNAACGQLALKTMQGS
jgi:23S rRNA (adenine2503-C2)-methyltransferase